MSSMSFSWLEIIVSFIEKNPFYTVLISIGIFLVFVAIYDIFIQKNKTIRHNFPVVGHIRYWLETIGPELRQYIVANDKEESPFNRSERRWIYASSKRENNYFGFGTTEQLYEPGYPIIKNSAFPLSDKQAQYLDDDPSAIPCLKIMGERTKRKRPYRPRSVVNISAMSYGSLGKRAISSMNKGAAVANCYHNTGEGGISPYHKLGADIMLQIGTGYFGVRDENGNFSLDTLVKVTEENPNIRAIEIKMSQGAKPGKGGVLPGRKVTKEIAQVRGIPLGQDCISPNSHSAFDDTESLLHFIEEIAEATGLPVGIKCAIGKTMFWEELSERIKKKKKDGPDFISIDGSEGGTGAAPLTFSDHVSLPFKTAFARVYSLFRKKGVDQDMFWIGSGKLGFPDRAIVAFAMGCDAIQIAREAMISIGCIQAQKCHTGDCPAGIATQSKWLESGIDIDDKAKRLARYLQIFRGELLSLAHTAGYHHPSQFTSDDIELSKGSGLYEPLTESIGYKMPRVKFTKMLDYTTT